ncbi:hypothetical protein VTJ04DRAFT_10630 [Mycothermus thermophilus]|uniref:uncharacterized protein n=1 Tax=Humicola insolens TaxID=85995 RepID=UPI003741EF75
MIVTKEPAADSPKGPEGSPTKPAKGTIPTIIKKDNPGNTAITTPTKSTPVKATVGPKDLKQDVEKIVGEFGEVKKLPGSGGPYSSLLLYFRIKAELYNRLIYIEQKLISIEEKLDCVLNLIALVIKSGSATTPTRTKRSYTATVTPKQGSETPSKKVRVKRE